MNYCDSFVIPLKAIWCQDLKVAHYIKDYADPRCADCGREFDEHPVEGAEPTE